MDTTVAFRRHLLNFDRPLYPNYNHQEIPRYYSSFFPWFRTLACTKECNSKPEIHPIKFPIHEIQVAKPSCKPVSPIVQPFTTTTKLIIIFIMICIFNLIFNRS